MKNTTHPSKDRRFDWSGTQATQCAMIYLFFLSSFQKWDQIRQHLTGVSYDFFSSFCWHRSRMRRISCHPELRKMMFDIVKGKKNRFPEGVWERKGGSHVFIVSSTDCKCCRSSKGSHQRTDESDFFFLNNSSLLRGGIMAAVICLFLCCCPQRTVLWTKDGMQISWITAMKWWTDTKINHCMNSNKLKFLFFDCQPGWDAG